MENKLSDALEVASRAGHILLENGAELSRVKETMERIATYYGIDSKSFFVLSNGIFTTGSSTERRNENFAKVQFIPFKGAQLDKVVAVNQLSREIEQGRHSAAQAIQRLEEIHQMPTKPKWAQAVAAAVGSGSFCALFGGGLADCVAATAVGLLLWLFVMYVTAPHLSKIFGNICGGALVSLLCMLFFGLGMGHSLSHIIIGAVILLVPGVPFTNGIRDLVNQDYLAGITRLLDATLVFMSIAIGICAPLIVYGYFRGGIILL